MGKETKDFKPGDILLFTQKNRSGTELRTGRVTIINHNNLGLVTYQSHTVKGYLESGAGAFDPKEIGTKPFGFYCDVKIIGFERHTWPALGSPSPGNLSYDLMC